MHVKMLAAGAAIAVTAAVLPVAATAAAAAPPPVPYGIWSADGTSLYLQPWVLQDPAHNTRPQEVPYEVAGVACTLIPFDKLGKVGTLAWRLKPGKKGPVPQQPAPDDPDRTSKIAAITTVCDDGLGWALAQFGPAKAWRDAKARGVCLRVDLDWAGYSAPDANPRYCLADTVATPRPGDPSVGTPRPANQVPRPTFTASRLPGAGQLVALDSTGSYDPDGRIVTWRWTSGRTLLATRGKATVRLGSAGTKSVTLTVTDDRGASSVVTRTLALTNRPPVLRAVAPAHGTVVGSNRPVLSAVAADDDGDRLQFSYAVTGPSVSLRSGWVGGAWTVPPSKLDPGTAYSWSVTVRDTGGATARRASSFRVAMLPTANDIVPTSDGKGYWQVASDGGVFTYGTARFYGSLPGIPLRVTNVLGMARTPTDAGYWLVGRDGGVFSFGDAQFHGSLPGRVRVDDIVGMAATKDGKGYWLVGADGGVFAFGSAGFYGSMGGKHLNAPVEALAVTASGKGYWLVARDGGVFAFGDAEYHGGMAGHRLNAPVVDIDTTPDGAGYYLTAEDGGVFTYGSARFHGSMGGRPLNGRVTSMGVTADGGGYWLSACDGGVFSFGNATFAGSRPVYGCRGT